MSVTLKIAGQEVNIEDYRPTVEDLAIQWRNREIERTDALMKISDYPYSTEMAAYRQELRDWTDSEDFPHTKPVPPTTSKGKPII